MRNIMQELFFAIDRHNLRLFVRRLGADGSLTVAIYNENREWIFQLSADDATRLAAALTAPRN
jgi:hypothetical protein